MLPSIAAHADSSCKMRDPALGVKILIQASTGQGEVAIDDVTVQYGNCPEYELRQYSASIWMSTNTAGVDYSKASSTNFMRLFRYISGTNTDGE
uniref:Uncharacterized protein n=1 Tax=Magallana gigas TaxID=29159 RepID=K1RSZ0_MAGGI